jgi:hypothetical protein
MKSAPEPLYDELLTGPARREHFFKPETDSSDGGRRAA